MGTNGQPTALDWLQLVAYQRGGYAVIITVKSINDSAVRRYGEVGTLISARRLATCSGVRLPAVPPTRSTR